MFLYQVTPHAVGFSPKRLARIDELMEGYVGRGELAGIVTLIARHGKIAHCKAFGWMDVEAEKPMTLDAIFRIFSMTKPITSVAAMMLYEQGRFLLDDPVAKYIPAFGDLEVLVEKPEGEYELVELERPMTIWHLLTHTAGLTYGGGESTVEAMVRDANILRLDEPLAEKMARLATLPLRTQPGAVWHYSVATDVLGYLVQVIADMPFETYLEEKVFAPLGMVDTAFYVPEDKRERLTAAYGPGENGALRRHGGPKDDDNPLVGWIRMEETPAFPSGGGGLVATTEDYLRFAEMLRRGGELDGIRLLGRKTLELMTMDHLLPRMRPPDHPTRGFGLGFGVTRDLAQSHTLGSVGDYGWSGAANTNFWVDPQEDLVGLLMLQYMPHNTYPVTQQYRVLAYQALVD